MSYTENNKQAVATEGSDEDLLRSFLEQRNEAHFTRLVQRNEDFAYRLAFGYCGQQELAEEIAQEAFVKVARSATLNILDGYPSFKSWFSGVVINVARHAVRTERRIARRTKKPEFVAMQKRREEPQGTADVPHLDSETRGALLRALAELSDDLRLPVVMHFVEGMSQEEIGLAAGVSQPTISKRLQKGLSNLKAQLARMGVAVSAASLPLYLKSENLLQAPATLQAARASLAARALKLGNQSVRAAAAAGGHAGKAALGALAMLTLGLGAWAWTRSSQAAGTQAPPAARPPTAAPEPVRAAWTFDKPEVAAEFRLTRGAWTWTSPEGGREAGMAVPDQALAELPVPLPARPMKITMRYVPLKHAMHAEFGCYYLRKDDQIPNSSWGKRGSVSIRPWFTITYYCYEEWVLCFQDGIPNYLSKYPKAYPTERIGVSLRNGLMFGLTLEPLSQEEAARLFEQPGQYIEANGFKPIR